MEYREPRTIEEACALIDSYGEDGKVFAGGTALVLLMRQRLLAPGCLISLNQIQELTEIRESGDGVLLGARATHRQVERSEVVKKHYAPLAEAFAKVATPRIRNAGTIGGNIALGDPHLDPPIALLALDAHLHVQSARGSREIPLSNFFVDYYETALQAGEMVTGVQLPAPTSRSALAFIKFLPRSQDDYATVDVAVWLQLADELVREVRIALGSVGPIPFRAGSAEAILTGERISGELLAEVGEQAAQASDPDDDVRGSAAYKRELIKVLVRRSLREAFESASTAT